MNLKMMQELKSENNKLNFSLNICKKECSFPIFIIFFLGFSSAEVSGNAHLLRRGSAT